MPADSQHIALEMKPEVGNDFFPICKQPTAEASDEALSVWLFDVTRSFYAILSSAEPLKHPAWEYMAEDAICEYINGRSYAKRQNQEQIRFLKMKYPDWHHVVHDITPHVYQDVGYAHVFVYHSIRECPPGVSMTQFSNWEWKGKGGTWKVAGYRCFNVGPAGI